MLCPSIDGDPFLGACYVVRPKECACLYAADPLMIDCSLNKYGARTRLEMGLVGCITFL